MPETTTSPALSPIQVAQRQRAALIMIVRFAFAALFVGVTALALIGPEGASGERIPGLEIGVADGWRLTLISAGVLGMVVFIIDYFTPAKKLSTITAVFFGLVLALLATIAIGYIIDLLAQLYGVTDTVSGAVVGTIKLLIGIGLAYLGVVTVLQTQDDFRLVIPYIEFAKQIRGVRPMLLDSSAIIDARIVEIGETGLIQAPMVIPRFVIAELQLLADSSDKLKRAKGRRGLELVARLQRSPTLDVSLDETPVPGKAVDQQLIELARAMPAVIVTTDLGLTRVARIQGVRVLNLNDLANAMKSSVIPGEHLDVVLIKAGEQQGQAVGYLDDGTMVVAEDGHGAIGQRVSLIVTSSLQTSAGRLIFGRLAAGAPKPPPHESRVDNAPTSPDRSPKSMAGDRAPARPDLPESSSSGPALSPTTVQIEPPQPTLSDRPSGPGPGPTHSTKPRPSGRNPRR